MARQSRDLSVTQKSTLEQGHALQKLFETGLPPDKPQTNAPSTKCHRRKQDLLQRRRDAERHNSSAAILKLPHEVFAMVCSYMSKRDMFGCLLACKALYLAVVPHLWRVLKLKFTKSKIPEEVRKRKETKAAEWEEHEDWIASLEAVGISKKTRRHREKGMKRDPRVSKAFEGLRLNVLRPRDRIMAMVPHIRALTIKEPYQAWSEQAFARTFEELLPKDFRFSTNMTCFRYESVDSNIGQNSMVDVLQMFCRLLPPLQISARPESDHTPTENSKRKRDADDTKDSQPAKLQRTEDARDTSEAMQGNTVDHQTCVHGMRTNDFRLDLFPPCPRCFDERREKEKHRTAMRRMSKVLEKFRPHSIGSSISRLELRGLAAVGVTFITQLTVLFPNITKLALYTGGPNAWARWKFGQSVRVFLRVFSQFHHLCVLQTNFTVHVSLSTNPLDLRHNPTPQTPSNPAALRPVFKPGRNLGSLSRPMHHVPLYLDRLPRQMENLDKAMACQDQWLKAHKCLLQDFARQWLWVQHNDVPDKYKMPLRSVTCAFGEFMKQEITFCVELDGGPERSSGTKFTADLPDDIIDLGIRDYMKDSSLRSSSQLTRELKKIHEEYAVLMQNLVVRNWHTCYERDVHEGAGRSLNYLDLVHVKGTFDYTGWYRDHGRERVGAWNREVRDHAGMDQLRDQIRERALDVLATVKCRPESRRILEELFRNRLPQSQLA